MFNGIGVGSDDPTDPTTNPIGACDPTLIRLFFTIRIPILTTLSASEYNFTLDAPEVAKF